MIRFVAGACHIKISCHSFNFLNVCKSAVKIAVLFDIAGLRKQKIASQTIKRGYINTQSQYAFNHKGRREQKRFIFLGDMPLQY
jgi:hypothetical protein